MSIRLFVRLLALSDLTEPEVVITEWSREEERGLVLLRT